MQTQGIQADARHVRLAHRLQRSRLQLGVWRVALAVAVGSVVAVGLAWLFSEWRISLSPALFAWLPVIGALGGLLRFPTRAEAARWLDESYQCDGLFMSADVAIGDPARATSWSPFVAEDALCALETVPPRRSRWLPRSVAALVLTCLCGVMLERLASQRAPAPVETQPEPTKTASVSPEADLRTPARGLPLGHDKPSAVRSPEAGLAPTNAELTEVPHPSALPQVERGTVSPRFEGPGGLAGSSSGEGVMAADRRDELTSGQVQWQVATGEGGVRAPLAGAVPLPAQIPPRYHAIVRAYLQAVP